MKKTNKTHKTHKPKTGKTNLSQIPDNDKHLKVPSDLFSDKKENIKQLHKLPDGLTPATSSQVVDLLNTIPKDKYFRSISIVKILCALTDPKNFSIKKNGTGSEFDYNKTKIPALSKDPVYDHCLHQFWSFIYNQKKSATPLIKRVDRGTFQRI